MVNTFVWLAYSKAANRAAMTKGGAGGVQKNHKFQLGKVQIGGRGGGKFKKSQVPEGIKDCNIMTHFQKNIRFYKLVY